MKLIFFRDKVNFGDQLNEYIIERMFDKTFYTNHKNINFVGIGTIIDQRISEDENTVIFGTGIRDLLRQYNTAKWDIRFVRGKLTAKCLNVKDDLALTDAAYCLHFINKDKFFKKEFQISLIPYYTQINNFNWRKICQDLGINLILPTANVEFILDQIQKSNLVISGSLHGVIVADVFRVPWMKLSIGEPENKLISEVKWADWLSSVNLCLKEIKIPILPYGTSNFYRKKVIYLLNNIFIRYYLKKSINKANFILSDNKIFQNHIERLAEKIKSFSSDYRINLRIKI